MPNHATAAFFEIPDSAIQSILARAEANYDVPFDNDQWRLERAKVDVGEKDRRKRAHDEGDEEIDDGIGRTPILAGVFWLL
ncbi:Resolvase domain protein [Halococcus salifodinae DSM 8989]|uniref:Resolvase domain protein n=1 Tax=Halococcus salifodinae DSM 8989 TaxID=1227456 RepID=M0N298_9EURY|nr:Resolvase domain protein [Halococcus salifodinae DSM 8989]